MGEKSPGKQPLAEPQVKAVEGSGDVPDLPQAHQRSCHTVQDPFEEKEAAAAFDVQQIQHVRRVRGELTAQCGVFVQATKDVLLYITDSRWLPQIIQAELTKTYNTQKHCSLNKRQVQLRPLVMNMK